MLDPYDHAIHKLASHFPSPLADYGFFTSPRKIDY
jgi:hypothetical protein